MNKDVRKSPLGLVSPYWQYRPVFRDLAVCLPFLEGEGLTSIDLIKRNGRADFNGATWDYNLLYGPCVALDGSQSVDTNRASNTFSFDSITFAYWASTESTNAQKEWLTTRWIDDDNFFKFGRYNNVAEVELKSGGNYRVLVETVTGHNDGKLHLWMFTSNAQGIAIYVDGKQIASGAAVVAGTWGASDWPIGSGDEGWVGKVSSCLIWERGLNPWAAQAVYNLGPNLGLNDESNLHYYGAVLPAVGGFNAGYAYNNNQVL